jgi:hypothetical protein
VSWFEEFLNETAELWFSEAEKLDREARFELRRGDLIVAVRLQGAATAYRGMARTFRRSAAEHEEVVV